MADLLSPMPTDDPAPFLEAADFARRYGTPSDSLGRRALAGSMRLTDYVGGMFTDIPARLADRSGMGMPGGIFGPEDRRMSAEAANAEFGLEGVLTFDVPVYPGDAAFRLKMARERQFREEVLSRTTMGPLSYIGGFIQGIITDPVGLPLMFAPELLGLGKLASGGWSAMRGGSAVIKAGRVANAARFAGEGAVEGLAGGAIYETANYGLRNNAGEHYTFADATRNLIFGAVLGAGFGGVLGAALPPSWVGGSGRAAREAGEAADGVFDAPEPVQMPREVAAMSEDARAGAAMLAIEAGIDDAPVRIDGLMRAERKAQVGALDEAAGAGGGLGQVEGRLTAEGGARLLDDDVAVTTRGTEIPVRYALAEMRDLVTSHDDDLYPNPDFPAELQPRDRGRAGAAARNKALEGDLNPKRLMREAGAESGAPIVSADGVVESGNGRTIALRRSAATGGEAWDRYLGELKNQGFDIEGMDQPVLVRVRTGALSGEDRVALTREMNADVTERLSPPEQAAADAGALDGGLLAMLQGDDPFAAGNRPFQRAFIDRIAADQLNTMVDEGGALTTAGRTRIQAALVQGAYGDTRLTQALFETGDGNIKTIGQALSDAAPAWSRMRASVDGGLAPPDLDLTANLRSAVDLVRFARDSGKDLAELVALRGGMADMFTGEMLSPETEAFLRLLFRRNKDGTSNFKQQLGGPSIAQGLIAYARRAEAHQPGGDLFGAPDHGPAAAILADVLDWLGKQSDEQAGGGDLLARLQRDGDAAADAAGGPPRETGAAGGDVRGPGGLGDRPGGSGGRPAGGGGAEGAGDVAQGAGEEAAKGLTPPRPRGAAALIAADPELKALSADTDALIAAEGLDVPTPKNGDPDMLAEAIRAAAFCIVEGGAL